MIKKLNNKNGEADFLFFCEMLDLNCRIASDRDAYLDHPE